MGEILVELGSFLLSEGLYALREKHPVLYGLAMGCILVLFGGMAVFFYAVGAPVKGTFMAVFTLAMGVLFVYGLLKDPKPARRTWNSWFAKRW